MSSASSSTKKKGDVPSGVPNLAYSDKGRWNIVYPIYLNNKKKISEGRQVPLARAVDRPNVYDIVDVCVALKLPHEVENKAYSRDFFERGRVRVQLKKDDGSPLLPYIKSRQDFLLELCAKIPTIQGRLQRCQQIADMEAKMNGLPPSKDDDDDDKSSSSSTASAAGGSTNNKKKNNKKKK